MTAEESGIQPRGLRVPFHDEPDRMRRQSSCKDPTAFRDRPKHRAIGDLGGDEPGLNRSDRTGLVPSDDGYDLPRTFLIGLRSANGHAKPLRPELKVSDVEGGKFGTAERASKAKEQKSP